MALDAWFVAETLPRAEFQAQIQLERQLFDCFCPRFSRQRRHARRIERVLAPLFPGYVFVRFDPDRDQWRSINGTTGVRRLIGGTPNRPQPMPQQAMEALVARCENGVVTRLVTDLEVGQRVRLNAGPFLDRLATVEELDDRGRVRVLLDILGGQVPARLAASDLMPA